MVFLKKSKGKGQKSKMETVGNPTPSKKIFALCPLPFDL
jgi:hypothetical protein